MSRIADDFDAIAERRDVLKRAWVNDPNLKLAEAWLQRVMAETLARHGPPMAPDPWPEDMPIEERRRRTRAAADDVLSRLEAVGAPVLNPKIEWHPDGTFTAWFNTIGHWRTDLT